MDTNNNLGKTLKQARLVKPLTLRELSRESGVSAAHLGRVERGERFPSGHSLGILDRLLGFIFWLYFSLHRLVNRKSRCPVGEGGIHLWVVRAGYVCRDCGAPMGRVAPGSDGKDK